MVMKRTIYSLILLLLLFSNCIYAHKPGGNPAHGYYVPHSTPTPLKSHEGYVVIKNSRDTLYGNILLGEEYHDKKCVALTLPRAAAPIYIPNDSLDYVRLFAFDSSIISTPYTEYRVLGKKNNLWRLLGKGKTMLYDNTIYCDEKHEFTGENLKLIDSASIIKASYTFTWDSKADVLRFIHKHYGIRFRRKDFKTTKDAIRYLVDKC